MSAFCPMPRKATGIRKSNIMKQSRKELQTTQAYMKIVPPLMSDVSCSANDLSSTTTLYQHSRVTKIRGSLLEKRIESSKPPRFKAMKGLVHKENNFNGANNEHKTHPSRVKEGSNANLGHVSGSRENRVKKLDRMTSDMFISRTFGKDLSNKQMELREGNLNFGYPKEVPKCKAKTNHGKRHIESLSDHTTIGEEGVQLDNGTCTQMKKRRRRKLILDDDDDDDFETNFGDQNLMAMNYCAKGSMHVEQKGYCCSKPIDEPTWRGIFKIGQKYMSLAGHLSTKCGEKVWKLSRSLLPVVEVTKLSRSKAWPKGWDTSKPNDDNIGLYFFPYEIRTNEQVDQLLKEVIENDLVLQAIIGEAEMLIFPSILLPEQYKTFKGKHYLWGVFKPRKHEASAVIGSLDVVGCRAKEEGEKEAKDFSINQDEEEYEKQDQETMLMNIATTSENQDLPARNTYEVQATNVQEMPITGFEPKSLEEQRKGDALCRSICTNEATVGDILQESHTHIDLSRRLPSGKVFGFVVGQTPRVMQLIQEMEREGVVVIAVQGEMLGTSLGK